MSSVDERIVKMVFDNAEFATKISSTIKSLTDLNKATDQVANNSGGGISALGKALSQAEATATQAGFHVRDVWLKVASIFENEVAGKIVGAAKNLTKSLTIEPILSGFKEYETQMDSVQTIMANTGLEGSEGLAKVNATLDELNEYADKTIYNFTQMTKNIGTFTAAGLDLDVSAKAIQGIANLAAVSGSTSQQASTAMYQLSQALASGTVKLQDWNSVVNAGMGGKVFQDALINTAAAMDGMSDKVDEWKKENIDGYGSFRESLTQGAWLTTEVLSQTLSNFTMAAEENSEQWNKYKKELMDMGYTEKAANDILKMANTATDAATKVKTFTQLIDTLQEAVGSGWSQTFRILFGDFEEAKELWTNVSNVLGGIIEQQSKARNDMLESWDKLGGRQQIIDSLANAFNFLSDVIKPISEALKEVFPPVTAKNLLYITSNLKKFTDSLKVTGETADKIKSVAKGFFSIFDIGVKFIKAFINAILPAGKGVLSLGDNLLDAAANIGDFISGIDESITKGKIFEKVFDAISKVVKPVFDIISSGAKGAIGLLGDFFGSFKDAAEPVGNVGDILKRIFEDISGGIENIKKKFESLRPIFEGISSLFKSIGKVLGTVFKEIADSISGISTGGTGINGILTIFNGLLTGGILYKVFSGVKSFSSIGEALTGALDSVSDAIGSFQKKIEAESLMSAAKAIGILAASLVVVAMVDSNKLLGATTAITTLMFGLAGAIAVLMKAVNSFSPTEVSSTFSIFGKELFGSNATKILEMSITLEAVAKALTAMGAAVLMMSVGLKVVSSAAEGGHLWDSFAVVSLILAELTAVTIVLGKWGNSGEKGAKGLVTITAALLLVAEALKMISKVVEGGNAWESLGILSIMLAELTGIVVVIEQFGKYNLGGMAGLISLAVSLNLCVVALKSVSDALGNDGNHIWESLGIISIMLAELAAITVLMSKFGGFAALGGAGAILAATSLLIMVQALKQVSDALGQTNQHIWQALGVIGASLLVLAVGLTAMAATIPGATGLLVASVGLIALGAALKIIGSLSLAEIGKGLITMAASLVILAAGLTAMLLALPGAVALTVAAVGLTALAGALALFGSMSLGEIVTSLGLLVVALAGLSVSLTALSVFSPFILIFSAALLAFGAALTVTSVGLTLFSAALQSLITVLPVAATAITILGTALLNLLPVVVEKVMDALAVLAEKIVEYAPVITQAAITIIESILTAIAESAIKFGEAVLKVILGILQVLTTNIPKIAKAGTDLMVAYMKAISNEIPRVVDEAYKCAIALINGLADAIRNNNGELIAAVDNLMDAAIQAVAQWIVEFTPLGLLIPQDMKDGIMSGEFNVKDAVSDVVSHAVEAIKGFFGKFKDAAEYLLGGLIDGLKGSKLGQVVSAAAEAGGKIIGGLNSKAGLDENSPSKKGVKSGEFLLEGVIEGMNNESGEAIDVSEIMGGNIADALNDPLKAGVADSEKILDGLSDVIDNESVESLKNLTKASEKSTDATNNNTKSFERNKKQQEANAKEAKSTAKAYDDLSTSAARAEKATQKKNESELVNVKAMKDSKDRAMALHEVQEKSTHAKAQYTAETEKNTEATNKNTYAQEANAKATGKAGESAMKEANVMDYASGVVEAFAQKYGHLYTTLGEDGPMKVAAFAVRNLAEETYKASLKAEEATNKNKETKASLEDMIKAFTDFKQKVYDSVESVFNSESFFMDKFEVKTELTIQQVLENMKSHIDGVTSWSAKLDELGNKGINEGLLKYLYELGPKGYELVNAFSTATTGEIEQANVMFEQAAALPETISNSTLASYAKAGLNCVQGFANGIDENVGIGSKSIEECATTYLKDFTTGLKEGSPSKATYDNGMWLIMGLKSGMQNYSFEAHNKIVEIAKDIIDTAKKNLDKDTFYDFGKDIGEGLAEGMEASADAVRSAAEKLSAIAASVTTSYNGISSPSKLYKGFGGYIADGFAIGIRSGVTDVKSSAMNLSDAVKNSIEIVKSIAEDDMEMHPVISPVLDLTSLKENAGIIGALFPDQSLALATSIGASMDSFGRGGSSTVTNDYTYGSTNIYITARDGESADAIADKVINKLDRMTSRRKAVNGL